MATAKRLICDEDAKRRIIALAVAHNTYPLPIDMVINVILHQTPTVEAVEVVHGRCEKSVMKDEWYGHIYTCKECKYQCMVDDGTGNDVAPNYCPNCGAKMDGDGNG